MAELYYLNRPIRSCYEVLRRHRVSVRIIHSCIIIITFTFNYYIIQVMALFFTSERETFLLVFAFFFLPSFALRLLIHELLGGRANATSDSMSPGKAWAHPSPRQFEGKYWLPLPLIILLFPLVLPPMTVFLAGCGSCCS